MGWYLANQQELSENTQSLHAMRRISQAGEMATKIGKVQAGAPRYQTRGLWARQRTNQTRRIFETKNSKGRLGKPQCRRRLCSQLRGTA